jgi:hypothetical protein
MKAKRSVIAYLENIMVRYISKILIGAALVTVLAAAIFGLAGIAFSPKPNCKEHHSFHSSAQGCHFFSSTFA